MAIQGAFLRKKEFEQKIIELTFMARKFFLKAEPTLNLKLKLLSKSTFESKVQSFD